MDRNEFLMMRLAQMLNEIRQYVGARYVPRFIDGGWDVTQGYEALDVVDNGQGTSYIAKKPVPVGTPLSDREYWFVYGASSGAIINLQQQIDAIVNNTIPGINSQIQALTDEVHNGDVIIIGNSYVYYGVADELKTHYVHAYTELAGSGAGFVAYSGQANTFANALTTCINGLTDEQKDNVRAVIFVSAMGDSRALQEVSNYRTLLDGAISTIVSTVQNDLPNCDYIAVSLAESRCVASFTNNGLTNLFNLHRVFKSKFAGSIIKYLGWCGFNIYMNSGMFESDNYHPSANGVARLGHELVKQVFGGFEYETHTANVIIDVDEYSTGSKWNLYETLTPEKCVLSLRQFVPANAIPTLNVDDVLIDGNDLSFPLPCFNEIDMLLMIKRDNDTALEGAFVLKADSNGVLNGKIARITSVPVTAVASNNNFCNPCEITIM